jgi:hypothetical protein
MWRGKSLRILGLQEHMTGIAKLSSLLGSQFSYPDAAGGWRAKMDFLSIHVQQHGLVVFAADHAETNAGF